MERSGLTLDSVCTGVAYENASDAAVSADPLAIIPRRALLAHVHAVACRRGVEAVAGDAQRILLRQRGDGPVSRVRHPRRRLPGLLVRLGRDPLQCIVPVALILPHEQQRAVEAALRDAHLVGDVQSGERGVAGGHHDGVRAGSERANDIRCVVAHGAREGEEPVEDEPTLHLVAGQGVAMVLDARRFLGGEWSVREGDDSHALLGESTVRGVVARGLAREEGGDHLWGTLEENPVGGRLTGRFDHLRHGGHALERGGEVVAQ